MAVVAGAEEAFGATGNAALGIGNADAVLLVVDLASGVLDKPTGAQQPAPAWAPTIVFEKGEPTGFDFSGTPEPTDALQVAALIKGDGAEVTKGQTIVVNYLGQVYGGEAPFDEVYTKEPYSTGHRHRRSSSRAGTTDSSGRPSAAGSSWRSPRSSGTAKRATRAPASAARTPSTSWWTSSPQPDPPTHSRT